MQCFRSEGVKVVKVVWGIWGLNMFCRVLSRLHNILISFQTPKLSSLSSLVHQFGNLFYKMTFFTNFLLTFTNLYLISSELVNLVKNRKSKKVYIWRCTCNGGELVNFVKTEKFTRSIFLWEKGEK
jgi:hypothetical protein